MHKLWRRLFQFLTRFLHLHHPLLSVSHASSIVNLWDVLTGSVRRHRYFVETLQADDTGDTDESAESKHEHQADFLFLREL